MWSPNKSRYLQASFEYSSIYSAISRLFKYIPVWYAWLNSLGVASHAWVVCRLRQLKKECKLTGMQVKSVELRLAGGARRNANDSKRTRGVLMNLNGAYTMHILVYLILKIAFLKVGIYIYYTVFFHFRPYNMTALDMYQLILKHHGTVPLYEKCSNSKLMYILAYTIY